LIFFSKLSKGTSINPSIEEQKNSWSLWNAKFRENHAAHEHSEATCAYILSKLAKAGKPLDILEIGCATGWMSERLSAFGNVTATDLAEDIVIRASQRYPGIKFIPGDFMALDFPGKFDLIVTMQTLPHIADQSGFARKVAGLLRPGGRLILTCQNRFIFRRAEWVDQVAVPGQIRKWPDRRDIKRLFSPYFRLRNMTTIFPDGHLGILRIANSHKVQAVLSPMISSDTLRRIKERMGLGLFIGVVGEVVQTLADSAASLPVP
jgi:2-polyprenyl-3-methyl-5-hydroxy-6-metoxy-1,4-benzoquinol methylase